MITSRTRKFAASICASLLCLLGATAANAGSTWNFGADPTTPDTCEGGTPTTACKQGGVTVFTSAFISTGLATNSTLSVVPAANFISYDGGLAVNADSTSQPNHALDNEGKLEMVLLRFDQAISLSQIKLGWADYDSDITVLAYKGNTSTNTDAAAQATINGKTLSGLKSTGGWELIGSYADVGTSSAVNVNSLAVTSTWWLVSAYNSIIGGTGTGLTNGSGTINSGGVTYANSGYDYVKIYSVSGNTSKTPEPGSLALAGLALVGVVGLRRKGKQQA